MPVMQIGGVLMLVSQFGMGMRVCMGNAWGNVFSRRMFVQMMTVIVSVGMGVHQYWVCMEMTMALAQHQRRTSKHQW